MSTTNLNIEGLRSSKFNELLKDATVLMLENRPLQPFSFMSEYFRAHNGAMESVARTCSRRILFCDCSGECSSKQLQEAITSTLTSISSAENGVDEGLLTELLTILIQELPTNSRTHFKEHYLKHSTVNHTRIRKILTQLAFFIHLKEYIEDIYRFIADCVGTCSRNIVEKTKNAILNNPLSNIEEFEVLLTGIDPSQDNITQEVFVTEIVDHIFNCTVNG
ncbi:hypothetical protein PCE1_000759 [Barthelona sp. PCE]